MEGVYGDDENSAGSGNGVNGGQNRGSGGIKRPRLSAADESGLPISGMGLGVNVNMNGYHHHLQAHGHPQYTPAHHAHHLGGDGSTVSSPGTTAPPSLLGVPGITVSAGGVPNMGSVGGVGGVKRSSRARSDSAPLGPYSYSSGAAAAAAGGSSTPGGAALSVGPSWLGGRPRSGSGLVTLNRSGAGGAGMGGIGGLGRNMGNLSGLASLSNTSSAGPAGGVPPPSSNSQGSPENNGVDAGGPSSINPS